MFLSSRLRNGALVAVLLSASPCWSQPASGAAPASPSTVAAPAPGPNGQRPKIGLVLSGGGARGAAHIGVLKVLEELRVPVDVIVGTSMGSIVGASYATGLTIPEMEKAIAKITTSALFTDKPPRADQSMRQKTDDLIPYLIPDLGIDRSGVALPKGVITGIALEGELRRLVQVGSARSFDDLPIPFRAVATDIGTGEMVVLKEGSVVAAIRASMSVPGAVSPAIIDNRQLVDGGLVRNLPIDVARQMGAEVIIAVNLGTPLLRPDQITSVLSVTIQMINILTQQNVDRSLKEITDKDILILPDLGDFSAADFDNLLKTVPIGEAAARQVADRLSRHSLPPEQYAALRSRQAGPGVKAPVVVEAIRVEGTSRVADAVVLQQMSTRVGEPLDGETIDLDMRRIYGRGDFESVNYSVAEENGKHTVVVLVKEKEASNYVRFGLELDADLGRNAEFNLYASHRWRWINSWGAEWRNDLVLGTNVLAGTEFYQPLGADQYFFIAPQLRYTIDPWYLFIDTMRVAEYQDKLWEAQLDIGANIVQYGELRVGAVVGSRSFELQSGDLVFPPKLSGTVGGLVATLQFDRLDSVNFPHNGYQARVRAYSSLSTLMDDDTYSKWEATGRVAGTVGRHTLEALLSSGGRLGDNDLPIYDQFTLGGFLWLSGLQRQQLRGDDYVFGRLVYRTKLAEIPFFEGVYFGASAEAARINPLDGFTLWDGELRVGRFAVAAGSVYLGVDSPLGPLYLGFGYANRDNRAVYLFLGRP